MMFIYKDFSPVCESSSSCSIHLEKIMATSPRTPKKVNLALHVSLLLATLEEFRVCFQVTGTGGFLCLLSLHDSMFVVSFQISQFLTK